MLLEYIWKPYETSKKNIKIYSLSSAANFSAFWRRERVVVLCIRKTCLRLLSATPDNSVPSVGTQRQFQYRGTAQDFDGKFILILLCKTRIIENFYDNSGCIDLFHCHKNAMFQKDYLFSSDMLVLL